MDYKITTKPGAALDGTRVNVYVLVDQRGEETSFGWWYKWSGAKKTLDALLAGAPLPAWDYMDE